MGAEEQRLTPGTHVVIKDFSLVRRLASEEEHYTSGLQNGIVLQLAHVWREGDERPEPTYLVLFSRDMRIYYVPESMLLSPDEASSPGRLFGRHPG